MKRNCIYTQAVDLNCSLYICANEDSKNFMNICGEDECEDEEAFYDLSENTMMS